jgi:flagella basal body P-ring formation protein FlgA
MRFIRPVYLFIALGAVIDLRAADPVAAPGAFSPDALAAAFARDLASHFNLEGDFQVEITRPWVPEHQVANDWTVEITEYPTAPASQMLVRCQVRDAGGTQAATILLHAALWRDAWAVHLPITSGDLFDATRLEVRRCDFLKEHEILPTSVGDETYMFSRAVPVGRMLTWHDIARHPLVKRGDLVECTAKEGMLTINMKALAMESGVRGDTITVRNPESRREFSAQVTDENHVQVQF